MLHGGASTLVESGGVVGQIAAPPQLARVNANAPALHVTKSIPLHRFG
jgi:hypothetical protein